MASSVSSRGFLQRFRRFWWLKYSPSTRFLPSPTAQSEAGLSVLGGTKMATQRLGWIRMPSRTPPRLRRQNYIMGSQTTDYYCLFQEWWKKYADMFASIAIFYFGTMVEKNIQIFKKYSDLK